MRSYFKANRRIPNIPYLYYLDMFAACEESTCGEIEKETACGKEEETLMMLRHDICCLPVFVKLSVFCVVLFMIKFDILRDREVFTSAVSDNNKIS